MGRVAEGIRHRREASQRIIAVRGGVPRGVDRLDQRPKTLDHLGDGLIVHPATLTRHAVTLPPEPANDQTPKGRRSYLSLAHVVSISFQPSGGDPYFLRGRP